MIRSYFGIKENPFHSAQPWPLLPQQQSHFEILRVHNQQGGLCLILGQPGTGKTVLKHAIITHDPKQWITPVINRSLHSWHNILRLLSQAMELSPKGSDATVEKRLIDEARKLNSQGKMIIPIIDDAHLVDPHSLRKLRLLLEDFPKNHNLILLGQPSLNATLQLRVHQDIKSRVTYSGTLMPLNPDDLRQYIMQQLDRVQLAHSTFTDDAMVLLLRSAEGSLRAAKNLAISALIEAIRDQTRTVDLPQINQVLRQPHWRENSPLPEPTYNSQIHRQA